MARAVDNDALSREILDAVREALKHAPDSRAGLPR
jgi:hypothetical protein